MPKHGEVALKSLRPADGSGDEALWEREWQTIFLIASVLGVSPGEICRVADIGCGGREMRRGAEKRGLS
jgi:hypothetical protein